MPRKSKPTKTITVYCDRWANVEVQTDGSFACPKCRGKVVPTDRPHIDFDCTICYRGWNEVTDLIKEIACDHISAETGSDTVTDDEIKRLVQTGWWPNQFCGCGSQASHYHYGHACCGGSMCCSKANI